MREAQGPGAMLIQACWVDPKAVALMFSGVSLIEVKLRPGSVTKTGLTFLVGEAGAVSEADWMNGRQEEGILKPILCRDWEIRSQQAP